MSERHLERGDTAVITGAGSGFGLELARLCAQRGMNVVAADVQSDALARAELELASLGAAVLPYKLDVSSAAEVEKMRDATLQRFGVPHLVFNNAGVGAGGLIWEHTLADWQWVIGVNVMGVAHGVRVFTPLMLEAAERDPQYEGHVVNTASMAGLVNPPNMGVYNVSKHAVVSLSETLYHDLSLVSDQVRAHVLCPFFVPTGIGQSGRNRPKELANPDAKPTRSQLIAQAMTDKAVGSGKVSAAMVAQFVLDAVRDDRFYIYSHPQALGSVQTRMEDVLQQRNPTDPLKDAPEMGRQLRAALRAR
ncbi:MAG TPA: SDR family oxidoreductase [Burkholderiaceae bacterium]|nr:SDR family oxidoreductase [Burkholderiaceae bacterium]